MDPELEKIRQQRMAQLQGQGGNAPQQMTEEQQMEQQQRREEMEMRRTQILGQVLAPDARERLARIALVKPEKARGVEDMIIQSAQRGQIRERIDENKIIGLLDQISQSSSKTKITFQRKAAFDDDEDDY